MSLQDIVNVQITKSGPGVTQVGFGVPLILGSSSKISPDRVRTYGSLPDVAADFAPSDPEYMAAAAMFGQAPSVSQIKIGRRLAAVAQVDHVTVANVVDSHVYGLTVAGQHVSFTSGIGTTAALIVAGLEAAINALVGAGVLASLSGSTLVITATVAGTPFADVADNSDLVVANSTPDQGVQEDLNQIMAIDNDWYAVMLTSRLDADIMNLAAWTEPQLKMACVCTNDPNSLLSSSTTDAFYLLKQHKYARTFGIWSNDQADYPDAAWLGRSLADDLAPNSDIWAYRSLAGIVADKLTATQINQLEARNANYYVNVGGVDVTLNGTVFDNEYIDSIRGIDWFQQRLEERIFSDMANMPKIPYTDGGAGLIENDIRAQIAAGIGINFIAEDPTPTVTVPKALSQTSSDRAARRFPGIQFSFRMAGAIQTMDISGFVSV